jgi:type IV pilus assembly protein PilE
MQTSHMAGESKEAGRNCTPRGAARRREPQAWGEHASGHRANAGRRPGFTLLEMMVVVAIVATLATLALPSYAAYVTRSRILEAVARLSDARMRMEEYFLDERTYLNDARECGAPPPPAGAADAFTVTCTATATTYMYTATGLAARGMNGFVYTIDQAGAKATSGAPGGWSTSADCWTLRADGLCS